LANLELGNIQRAITDFTEVIRLDPENYDSYYCRGIAKDDCGDIHGAIDDYTEAIRINPDVAAAYFFRGVLRNNALGDKQNGLTDLRKAAQLYQEEGNSVLYKKALENIESIENSP
jgi:tetratricopeptide (TPR) repeat protein